MSKTHVCHRISPQMPDEAEAQRNWAGMETASSKASWRTPSIKRIHDRAIETAIKDTNRKNSMMDRIFDYAACTQSLLSWQEMYDLTSLHNRQFHLSSLSLQVVSRPWSIARRMERA